jgi:dihydrofolate synthase/folylpolyglutamate synthase
VLLDVAHNVEAAEVLGDHLRAHGHAGRVLLVLGMLADKPVEGFGRALEPLVRRAFLGSLPGPRGLAAVELAARLRGGALEFELCGGIGEALARAQAQVGDDELIVVTGSFLTVTAALEHLGG